MKADTSPVEAAVRTLARRLAAKFLGDYTPPALRHAEELLRALDTPAETARAGDEWSRLAAEIRAALRGRSPDEFLRLPPIVKTVHPPMRSLGRRYWAYLLRSARFSAAIQQALSESPVGKPLLSPHYPLSSPLLVQHGYHLVRLLESTDFDLSRLRLVVEFGGGYGSFFRLLRNLGYRDRYIICDLPLMCALQRFYLRNVFPSGPQAQPPDNLQWLSGNVAPALQRELGEQRPALEHASGASGASLFVATWSLSEAPLAVREGIAPVLDRFDYILCAYQRTFGGCDNVGYFGSLERSLPGFIWHHRECPIYRNNFYLIGRNAASQR